MRTYLFSLLVAGVVLGGVMGCERLSDQGEMLNAGYAVNDVKVWIDEKQVPCVVARTTSSVSVDCDFE